MMNAFLILLYTFLYDSLPPNTVKINNYYIDRTEIMNIHWLEYIHHRKNDSIGWEITKLYPAFENKFYDKPEHRYKPIVLITYEQAQAYCIWRSQEVSKRLGRTIVYRLPTEKEWMEIAQTLQEKKVKHIDKEFKRINLLKQQKQGNDLLVDIVEFKSETFHFFSNVSEMVAEKGRAMGLNNLDITKSETNYFHSIKHENSNQLVGFRCIAEFE